MRSLFILSAVLALQTSAFAGPAVRVQSAPAESKCNAAQCRARAAFAFERLAAESRSANTAPAPHAKACPCGAGCECAAGTCPACPAVQASAPGAPTASPAKPTVYREVWRADGRGRLVRELVPIDGDGPALKCADGTCALGR